MADSITADVSEADIRSALSAVKDPELDEPITELGFVTSVDLSGNNVLVRLRLPTSFCAPNFAYLMASDSMDAVRGVPGIGHVQVVLDGNTDSERINAGIAAGLGFAGTYPEESEIELDELRRIFQVKAHFASIERVISRLVRDHNVVSADLHEMRLGDLPDIPEVDGLRRRRIDIGLPNEDSDFLLVDDTNTRWDTSNLEMQLRFARATRISIDGNAHFCRGLLKTRYPESEADQAPRPEIFDTESLFSVINRKD